MGRGGGEANSIAMTAAQRAQRRKIRHEAHRILKEQFSECMRGSWGDDYEVGRVVTRLLGRLNIDNRSLQWRRGAIENFFPGLTYGAGEQSSMPVLMLEHGLAPVAPLRNRILDRLEEKLRRGEQIEAERDWKAVLDEAAGDFAAAREREFEWVVDRLRVSKHGGSAELWSRALDDARVGTSKRSARSLDTINALEGMIHLDRPGRITFLLNLFDERTPGYAGAVHALAKTLLTLAGEPDPDYVLTAGW